MFWFIVAAIITVGAFIWTWHEYSSFWEGVIAAVRAAACGGIIALIVSMIVGLITMDAKMEPTGTQRLAAVNDSSKVSDSFFLGTGYVDEEFVYVYYADHGTYYDQHYVYVSDAIIKEEDREDAELEFIEDVGPLESFWGTRSPEDTQYVFHVPRGSVDKSYTFDLE